MCPHFIVRAEYLPAPYTVFKWSFSSRVLLIMKIFNFKMSKKFQKLSCIYAENTMLLPHVYRQQYAILDIRLKTHLYSESRCEEISNHVTQSATKCHISLLVKACLMFRYLKTQFTSTLLPKGYSFTLVYVIVAENTHLSLSIFLSILRWVVRRRRDISLHLPLKRS